MVIQDETLELLSELKRSFEDLNREFNTVVNIDENNLKQVVSNIVNENFRKEMQSKTTEGTGVGGF